VEGVVAAEVSYDDKRAVVRIRPDQVKAPALVQAVHDIGFEARAIVEPSPGAASTPEGATRP
jgi:copper chaperone CopZ